ncbi:nucleoside triphosphate pyrophosphohydrolase [Rhodovulum sp. DZ06]|uniref:nucleoside triphosphate pyrophosphohydrolase n=1 Tax=Rhodovulum sp. DZ06 TaxID=3425126 RepID=UPI003D32AF26
MVHDGSGGTARLLEIMRRLRAPDGCPWDLEQDFATIAPYTIEEAYEVADAIEKGDMGELRDELGDLLLQVVYHAQMAQEGGWFGFEDVAKGVADKMLRRHPHVFGHGPDGRTAETQVVKWEEIKAQERAAKGLPETPESALDGVALGLPALLRAVKLQNRAARVGFDWPVTAEVIEKIREEAAELEEARDELGPEEIEEEFGDLLFVMANLARHLKVEPEGALRAANAKFERRFRAIEDRLRAEGRSTDDASLEEMDAIWDAVKAEEKEAKAAKG